MRKKKLIVECKIKKKKKKMECQYNSCGTRIRNVTIHVRVVQAEHYNSFYTQGEITTRSFLFFFFLLTQSNVRQVLRQTSLSEENVVRCEDACCI